jgi:hypothetical protein
VLGQAVNILAPLRFGEGGRLAVTCRGLDVPVGRVMVRLARERAFDVAAFPTIVLMRWWGIRPILITIPPPPGFRQRLDESYI